MLPSKNLHNEGQVAELVLLYKKTYRNILEEMLEATEAGTVRRRQILANIDRELKTLGVDTQKWIDREIPRQYKEGMKIAIKQLDLVPILDVKIRTLFTGLNKQAVQAMIDEASLAFGQSLTGVGRSARRIANEVFQREVKARLAEGVIKGETRKEIVASVKNMIREQGLTAVEDRAGRTWTLDRYSDMLARTKLREARNTGLTNKMLENGNDLVQINNTGSSHAECAEWEGQIVSLTGKTEGYPTLDEAVSGGIFHPNCQHSINAVEPALASRTYGYDSDTGEYERGIIE